MKFCIVLGIIVGLTLGTISVSSSNIASGTPNCKEELWTIYTAPCAPPKFQMTNIIDNINHYRDHTINETRFSQSITEYCDTLKTASACSMQTVTTVSPACHQISKTQDFVNLLRIIVRIENVSCSESYIYEIANDKGFNCLDERKFISCMREIELNQDGELFENKNVCATIQLLHTCSNNLFDECENDGIFKNYVGEVLNGTIQDFTCA